MKESTYFNSLYFHFYGMSLKKTEKTCQKINRYICPPDRILFEVLAYLNSKLQNNKSGRDSNDFKTVDSTAWNGRLCFHETGSIMDVDIIFNMW